MHGKKAGAAQTRATTLVLASPDWDELSNGYSRNVPCLTNVPVVTNEVETSQGNWTVSDMS
jgi:hypothetical protein